MTPIIILDGGLGTSLEQFHGVKFNHETPLWSTSLLVTDPDTLLECQASFGAVPVDVILTATYQLSIEGFAATKSSSRPDGYGKDEVAGFVDRAVDIAAKATGGAKGSVALSVGPYGACMVPSQEYSGKYDEKHDALEDLEAWHRDRLAIMGTPTDIGPRLGYIALETVPRLDEITAMRRAVGNTPTLTSVPYWISCLYPTPAANTLPDGSSVRQAVRAMLDPTTPGSLPWGIGINCTKVHKLASLVKEYEAAVKELVTEGTIGEWPALVLYPDGTNGEVYNTTTQTWDMPSEGGVPGDPWERQIADVIKDITASGNWKAIVVGGCCMASPDHIKRLRRLLEC